MELQRSMAELGSASEITPQLSTRKFIIVFPCLRIDCTNIIKSALNELFQLVEMVYA
jgi:hypothetical protein